MVRTGLVAALLALPLAACDVGGADSTPSNNAQKPDELAGVSSALSAMPGAEVIGSHEDGVPFALRGRLGAADRPLTGFASADAHRSIAAALPGLAASFRLNAADLVASRVTVDEQGHTHIRYNQTKNGLPVRAQELIVHVDPNGDIYFANGTARDGEHVSAKARVSADAAALAATRGVEGRNITVEGQPALVYIRSGKAEKLTLAYEVRVKGEGANLPVDAQVYVNAQNGGIETIATNIHTAMNRALYHGNNTTSLPGTLRRSEGGAATADAHIDQNYDHLGTTYNCYKTLFNRDSYNNAGAQLRSTVHHGTNYVNAFWNGSQMVYGDGDGVQSGMLGKDLDVTVHELTHAVTSSESNLTYSNESGALNESMSDIFAAVCESWTRSWATDADVWKIGEDIWTPATAGDALRYMANPTQDGSSKDYYPTRYVGTSDNGGVHWNSGIANLAFKLLATGGTHPRGVSTVNVTGVGVEVAARIFYKANVDLMTASTTFAQAKTYTAQAATSLGYSAAIVDSVNKAWEAVGVGIPVACTTLTNGVLVSGISGAASSEKHYCLDVPAGKAVSFVMSGGTGDADLYVKYGAAATTGSYDCRPYLSGNNESCNIAAKTTSGRFYVMVRGYSSYSSTSLKGTY